MLGASRLPGTNLSQQRMRYMVDETKWRTEANLKCSKHECNNCFIKFNKLSETFKTCELHPDFYSVPFRFYKTNGSRHGIQRRENQMKRAPFATAVERKFEC